MSEPSAKVIADSISGYGDRLTTMEVVIHRFVLAELNTHRAFSRNSASSRAIPVKKQLEKVLNDPAIPLSFPSEQGGMQGGEELEGVAREMAIKMWLYGRDCAVDTALLLRGQYVHKSVVNRLLEPFMWHTVIISSTEWDNFWVQRCSPLAQPEMRVAAEAMKAAYDASTPTLVPADGWHLPYVSHGMESTHEQIQECLELGLEDAKKVSVARCARVSYLTHDGKRDLQADIDMYERLVSASPPHASPLEHVATPSIRHGHHRQGNFTGWDQLRHQVLA